MSYTKCMMAGCDREAVEDRPSLVSGNLKLCVRCSIRPAPSLADIVARLKTSGLPMGYMKLRDSAAVTAARNRVAVSLEDRTPLALIGPTAVGKTLTLAVAVHRLIELGGSACYRSVPKLQQEWRSSIGGAPHLIEYAVEYYSTVPNLILDDIGAQYDSSGWFTSLMYRITDSRMTECRSTWTAMNDEASVDARLLRRLTENALVIKLEGDL